MDSNHSYSNQKLTIPPLKLSHTSRAPLHPQSEIIIPSFHGRPVPQLSGFKRSDSHFFEQNIMRESIPSKKIKVGTFNMLAKVNFSNKDPYWPAGCGVDSPKSASPSMKHQELNTKIITEKGLTINISTKKTVNVSPLSKSSRSVNQSQRMPERPYLRNVQSRIAPNFNRLPDMREPLYHLISQKLEENCFTLFQSMKDLMILRQHFSARNHQTPVFDLAFEDTLPGTPCTVSAETIADASPRGGQVEKSQMASVGKSILSTPAVSRQISIAETNDSETEKAEEEDHRANIELPEVEVKKE